MYYLYQIGINTKLLGEVDTLPKIGDDLIVSGENLGQVRSLEQNFSECHLRLIHMESWKDDWFEYFLFEN